LEHSAADPTLHDAMTETPHISQAEKDLIAAFGAHADRHENGGADEISVAGLSGELADPQPPKAHASSHASGGSDALSGNLNANARVAVSKNSGATVGTRRRINLIEGSNVTLTIADDEANEEVDVTIEAVGGGTPGSSVQAERWLGIASAVGTSTAYARADHTHGSPPYQAVMSASRAYNNGFEHDTDSDGIADGWFVSATSPASVTMVTDASQPEGKYALKLHRETNDAQISTPLGALIPVNPNEVYELRVSAKASNTSVVFGRVLFCYDKDGNYLGASIGTQEAITTSWARYVNRWTSETAAPGAGSCRFYTNTRFVRIALRAVTANGDVWVDDVWFGPVRSWAGYQPSSGVQEETIAEPCVRTGDIVTVTIQRTGTSVTTAMVQGITNLTSIHVCKSATVGNMYYVVHRP